MASNTELIGEQATVRQFITGDFSATDGRFQDQDILTINRGFYHLTGLTSVLISNATKIGANAFDSCSLVSASFPKVTQINSYSFHGCSSLIEINLPELKTINYGYHFRYCKFFKFIVPKLETTITSNCLRDNSNLRIADLGYCTGIAGQALINTPSLITIVFRRLSVVPLTNIDAFNSTRYATNGAGGAYVYVPSDLISSYQAATNWATLYAAHPDMFRPLEDYTVDGTTTGEFDESMIATPLTPLYAVTDLDVSPDENHPKFITTTEQGHITYKAGAFTDKEYSSTWASNSFVSSPPSGLPALFFTVPANATVTLIITNMTATNWNNQGISIGLERSGARLIQVGSSELKQAFYTNGLKRLEKTITNNGTAKKIYALAIMGFINNNNIVDFGVRVLIDGVRYI